MKKSLAILALTVTFAVPAIAQTKPRVYLNPPKTVQPLSKEFAKVGLKAVLAIHDFIGGEVDSVRVKGLIEDATLSATTDSDTAVAKAITQYLDLHLLVLEMSSDFKEKEDRCDADSRHSYEECQALKTQDSSRKKDVEYREEQSFETTVKRLKS